MPSSKDKIREDLETLILSKYTLPPKQFAEEEIAVKQTIQKLLLVLGQPENQISMLPSISVESIENMTRRGQLTLVANNLDDNFLRSIEGVLKKTNIEFQKDGEKIVLSNLYNRCKKDLIAEKGKEPNFGDVLLRMYTEDSPFYKKLNAIVGGYNDPTTTTDSEKKLALLLNVAIHKAGLNKRKFEVQQTPDELYRGQSFGLDNFVKKFERTKELQTQGKLTTLSPEELAEINVVDIVGKKIASTSTDLQVTSDFATKSGVVIHIKNPEQLADFYNVANISKFANEEEFISRIPDDIAIIPIDITKDVSGVSHIEVVCIHSENVLLHNSTRMNDIRDSLRNYIKNEIYQSSGYFTPYFFSDTLNQIQKEIMEKLVMIVNESEALNINQQDKFLEIALTTLAELYKTTPTTYPKERFDVINSMLQEYAAVVADLKVVHGIYDSKEIIAQEQEKLNANLAGKRIWVASIAGKPVDVMITPIKSDLNKLLDPASSSADIRQAANNILESIKTNVDIEKKFPMLRDSMNDVIISLDKIEKHQQILKESQVQPTVVFKSQLRQIKSQEPEMENIESNTYKPN
ncbi:hypothetical protein EP47_03895 [Legionella norrlandica]|uniref:Uncharacterized protein n=1 Tax=Legionella norrlandica TaxID=1498499 RepID=A0A0A2SSU5_9GAMM|nr:hypothetical protein [Legionella norrlandica]KGP64205.1 hypothetical protein EP47_03895 [Legionella norrlandica]